MQKKKKTPSGKHTKSGKKSAASKADPEWDVLEERYSGISPDFAKLVNLVEKQ